MLTFEQSIKKERRTQWERRFQSVMLSLVATAIIWGVSTLVSVDKGQATTNVRLQAIEIQQSGTYAAKDAKRDVSDLTGRIDNNSHRIDAIDGRVLVIERRRETKPL